MTSTEPDIDGRIGLRIRALRLERDLTLDALASLAKVSRAMLSRIERAESSPTAQLLVKICSGLGTTLSALFAEPASPGSRLSRRSDQPTWRDPATHYRRRIVSPTGTGSPVDIVEVEFPPGGSIALDSLRLTDGDQHVWVIEGTLDLSVGDDAFSLEAGDCLFMQFDRPTRFSNPTERPVRYAVVVSHGIVEP